VLVGEYDKLIEGMVFHTTRASKPLLDNLMSFYEADPVLLIVGIAGIIFSTVIKRDMLFLFWIIPFLTFLYVIDYVSSFFLIPLIPPFCIASGILITDLSNRIAKNKRRIKELLPLATISMIGIFGFASTTAAIMESENSSYFNVLSSVTRYLPKDVNVQSVSAGSSNDNEDDDDNPNMTVIGNPRFNWILQYVFDKPEYNYKTQYNLINIHTLEDILDGSEKVIMIADRDILEIVRNEKEPDNAKAQLRADRLSEIYYNTNIAETVDRVEIRTNY
jgi:hypothetical protein